ncbi:FMN-binding protein [Micromonospora mirobrigensis]|uniref:Uncharacterized protein, contains FMN-binding domain n=1 Tax=Micromonospora mirobrigensis TaxID=262898 RepID=A0A1C5AFE7_9ACTN|nr:FMN-binding protein [Micromonospora mirobrigensis]SCF43957.1 Uncharacterized protein, contains FMN-binding domain [Micromonospora mirobrigensis]
MRRALLAITGLAASTTALVALKGSPGAGQPTAQDLPADQAPAVPGATTAPRASATPPRPKVTPSPSPRPSRSATARPSRTPDGATSTRTRTSAPRTTTAAPRTTTAAPRTTTAAPTNRKVTGPVISNEYGNVQVQITLSGSRITDCVALELPQGGQSDLRSDKVDAAYSGTSGQVVQRQSASLDTVSGATYTSNSYKQSLQAAIDQAR